MLAGGPVRTARRHRVEGVRHRNYPRTKRDLVAGEPVGIAGAVEALVVMAHHRGDLGVAEIAHHRGTVNRMLLDDLELRVVEAPRLRQYLARRLDLADVVHSGRDADLRHQFLRHAQLAGDPLRMARHALGMAVRVGVPRLERRGQLLEEISPRLRVRAVEGCR